MGAVDDDEVERVFRRIRPLASILRKTGLGRLLRGPAAVVGRTARLEQDGARVQAFDLAERTCAEIRARAESGGSRIIDRACYWPLVETMARTANASVEDALESCRVAVEDSPVEPSFPAEAPALMAYSRLLFDAGEAKSAMEYANRAVDLSRGERQCVVWAAWLRLKLREHDAVHYAREALERDPSLRAEFSGTSFAFPGMDLI